MIFNQLHVLKWTRFKNFHRPKLVNVWCSTEYIVMAVITVITVILQLQYNCIHLNSFFLQVKKLSFSSNENVFIHTYQLMGATCTRGRD